MEIMLSRRAEAPASVIKRAAGAGAPAGLKISADKVQIASANLFSYWITIGRVLKNLDF
jgi:hypothetical protein